MSAPALVLGTFHMPDRVGKWITRDMADGVISACTIYYESSHHGDNAWIANFVSQGGQAFHLDIHAKFAILQSPTQQVVFLSSNNFKGSGHTWEFYIQFEGGEAAAIADEIRQKLEGTGKALKAGAKSRGSGAAWAQRGAQKW